MGVEQISLRHLSEQLLVFSSQDLFVLFSFSKKSLFFSHQKQTESVARHSLSRRLVAKKREILQRGEQSYHDKALQQKPACSVASSGERIILPYYVRIGVQLEHLPFRSVKKVRLSLHASPIPLFCCNGMTTREIID